MENLMIIDVQKGQINDKNKHIVEGINKLLKENEFKHVIYTRFYNHEESPYVKFLNYREMLTDEEIEICVDDIKNSYIFPKVSYGICPEQLRFMKEKGIEEIFLCGTDLDACVLAIAYNLFDNGIRPKFLWNLIGSKNKNLVDTECFKNLFKRNFGSDSIIE